MQVDIMEDLQGFEQLQEDWNALVQRSATRVPFLTYEYQRAWWDAFGAGKQLRLCSVRDNSGRLSAILPLFAMDVTWDAGSCPPEIHVERSEVPDVTKIARVLFLVGGTEVSDYLDLIAPPQFHHEAWAAILAALAARSDWQALDLHCIPSASPTLTNAGEFARSRRWTVWQGREDVCPLISLPTSWEAYLAQNLNKKQRHELRRKMRRAEEQARVDWYWVKGLSALDEGLQVFFRLHKASHMDKEAFMDETMQGFFRKIARVALEQGYLRLAILRFNGQPVAGYLCFDYGGDRLVYNSGFDQAAYADLSPGLVLVGYMIEDAIQQGLRHFDFMRGGERYKYDFGPQETEVLRLLLAR